MMKKNLTLLILTFCIFNLQTAHSQSQKSENSNKLESIIKLIKFIDWSENTQFSNSKKSLYILSNADTPIIYELSSKKSSNNKNWQVICTSNLKDIKPGSVVYITKEKKNYLAELIRLSKETDIFTIAENQKDFCENGGMINLIVDQSKIRFEINYKIIQHKSLNISSKVLALAKIYDNDTKRKKG